jgi:hypothetical protein
MIVAGCSGAGGTTGTTGATTTGSTTGGTTTGGTTGGTTTGSTTGGTTTGGTTVGPPQFYGIFDCIASQSQVCQGSVGSGTYDISAGICPMVITMGAGAGDIVTTHHDMLVDKYTASDSTHASLTAPETYPDFANPFGPGTITMFNIASGTMMLTAASLIIDQSGTFVWAHGTNTSCTFTRSFTGSAP